MPHVFEHALHMDGGMNDLAETLTRLYRKVRLRILALIAAWFGSNERTEPAPSAPYDLGVLPDELRIRWPTAPLVERDVTIARPDDLGGRWTEPGTRLHIRTDIDWLILGADDLEVVVDDGVRVGRVFVEQGHKRIRFVGGTYGQIELQIPGRYFPPPEEWRERWMVEDVLFERVRVVSDTDTAFLLRGRRIAIVQSVVEARRYAIWCGDTDRFRSQDVILAGNRLECDGEEATVRLVDVLRSVVVDNWLTNPVKHNYRVHGRSDLNFAARNTLVDAGVMLASMPGDDLGAAWFLDNAIHNATESLLVVDEDRVRHLELTDNEVFSDRWSCFWCDPVPEGWVVERNIVTAYRAPSPTPREA